MTGWAQLDNSIYCCLLHLYGNIKSQHKESTSHVLHTKEVLSLGPAGSQGPKPLESVAEELHDLFHK